MRAFLLSLAAAFNEDALLKGSCALTLPALDESCHGTAHGSFNADSVNTAIDGAGPCAQHINEHCNVDGAKKAIYFTYSPGTFDETAKTGICSWFALDGCACGEAKDCKEPENAEGEKVSGVVSGKIDDYLHDAENGVAAPNTAGETGGNDEGTVPDPNLSGDLAADAMAEGETAEKEGPQTIPSAQETISGKPSVAEKISEDDGHHEAGCPGFEQAQNRKEWPCLVPQLGGLKTGPLAGYVVGCVVVGMIAGMGVHVKGNKIRKGSASAEDGAALSGQDSDA